MRPDRKSFHIPVAIFVVLCLGLWYISRVTSTHRINYGLMFDAGSTGSRVHVYSFDANSGKLLDEIFREIKPGLSSYKDPTEAAASLKPLLDIAVNAIPKQQHKCTPLALKATAGLRRLGQDAAEKHLQAVRDLLATYPFHTDGKAVEIMSGDDEGAFAWITINHLLGRLEGNKKTVSVMDLGGGSTQIVLEPNDGALEKSPKHVKYDIKMGPTTHTLYQHSYDGWGLHAAREKMFGDLVSGNATPTSAVEHPCVPNGHEEKVKLKGQEVTFVPSKETSFAKCAEIAKKILNKDVECKMDPCSFNGVHQPRLADPKVFDSDMYAISYFYDRTQLEQPQPDLTVGDFKKRAEAACAAKSEDASHGVLCADLTYMHALLSHGYSLQDDQKLKVAKKINGIETAWSLGAMVVLMKNGDLTCTA